MPSGFSKVALNSMVPSWWRNEISPVTVDTTAGTSLVPLKSVPQPVGWAAWMVITRDDKRREVSASFMVVVDFWNRWGGFENGKGML